MALLWQLSADTFKLVNHQLECQQLYTVLPQGRMLLSKELLARFVAGQVVASEDAAYHIGPGEKKAWVGRQSGLQSLTQPGVQD